MMNALSIDVEDYFHVNAFAKEIRPEDWDRHPRRVDANTRRVLDLLDVYGVKATFFLLGWVAEKCPAVAREIAARGHEVACHGYGHQLLYAIGPERFRHDLGRSRKIIEDLCGKPVRGYRAPSYSITERSLWAFEILIEEGFSYDSSVFPITHDVYGIPEAERFPFEVATKAGTIQEFPLTTLPLRALGKEVRLPIAGGGYLRLLPAWFVSQGIARINGAEGRPAVVYFHPWEIDPGQPRIAACWKSRFRHYHGLDEMEGKIVYLLSHHAFAPLHDVLQREFGPGSRARTPAVVS